MGGGRQAIAARRSLRRQRRRGLGIPGRFVTPAGNCSRDRCSHELAARPLTARTQLSGIAFGLVAYGLWGFFPLFFHQLSQVPPMDILSHRAFWACVFVSGLLTLRRQWSGVAAVVRNGTHLLLLGGAALLIGVNWLVFLWAVDTRQVVASSLGYFLTPLVNVVLGLVVLGERLDRLEWLAVSLAVAAIANEILAFGSLPWVSLVLATTFGTYGLIRKRLPVDVAPGLWLETLVMLPLCVLYAAWQAERGHSVWVGHAPLTMALLIGSGVLTAVPLLAFAAAARRLDLVTLGMLMYINPTLQFVTAVRLFGEPMQASRLLSFGLIWLGLLIFSWRAWRKYRSPR
ncbi:MAG: EamA family transporter RarD [Accumulibacter sp.]|jgi:chloramphenicol-sensitive protein RarD|uniref:EamA family transporter RarD n=1 Tax=Accumulibacter sp. TaxID=2053492 RepID=UPI002FC39425